MTTLTLCPSCQQLQPNAAAIPHAAFICPHCTSQTTTPHLALSWRVWRAIRARLRLTVVGLAVVLYLLAMAGMGLVILMR